MAASREVPLTPVIQEVINQVNDKNRLSAGIQACRQRERDFASKQEMELAGVAMVPEARELMNEALTDSWARQSLPYTRYKSATAAREVIIGGGLHAAIYSMSRQRLGYQRPVVLERGTAQQVGGAFAMSLHPVFRLNSRNRPGGIGLPDQDKALNYFPGGLLQPSMLSSEEYSTNADMAWLIRLMLAQSADVYPQTAVTGIDADDGRPGPVEIQTVNGKILASRVIDARGVGDERSASEANGETIFTFSQLMARMGTMFPLRGMQQVAVIGSGNSAQCAVESLLGMAPGNTSALGLDYVTRVDWYTGGKVDGLTCEQYRQAQRGRYVRIAQYLAGNASNPSTRLQLIGDRGYATPVPGGVLVNDRTYDMAVLCTGSKLEPLGGTVLSYYPLRANGRGTVVARSADPFPLYRIGPAADLDFSNAEAQAGITANPPSRVAIFRLAARTAALAAMLPAVGE